MSPATTSLHLLMHSPPKEYKRLARSVGHGLDAFIACKGYGTTYWNYLGLIHLNCICSDTFTRLKTHCAVPNKLISEIVYKIQMWIPGNKIWNVESVVSHSNCLQHAAKVTKFGLTVPMALGFGSVCGVRPLKNSFCVSGFESAFVLKGELPVGHPPPLVRLCRVRVDADCSVAVSDGRVGLLHLDVDAAPKNGND